jgi:hypothetical protein
LAGKLVSEFFFFFHPVKGAKIVFCSGKRWTRFGHGDPTLNGDQLDGGIGPMNRLCVLGMKRKDIRTVVTSFRMAMAASMKHHISQIRPNITVQHAYATDVDMTGVSGMYRVSCIVCIVPRTLFRIESSD